MLLLLNYTLSMIGNLTIIALTLLDSHLKTPMYFFLCNFSFLEISFTSACIPRFLITTVNKEKMISYIGCMSQLFFYIFLEVTEFFLLVAMSYDRYFAICKPLRYTSIMSSTICHHIGTQFLGNWILGYFPSTDFGSLPGFLWFKCHWSFHLWYFSYPTTFLLRHTFTRNDCIFISCDNPRGHIAIGNSFLLLYHQENSKLPFSSTKEKAFSTCSSHMIVVSITYGSCLFIYIKPSSNERITLSKGVAVLNTSTAPLLNTFIYTLRNQQIKQAFRDVYIKIFSASDK